MTRATATADSACVVDLHVDFGAVTQLRYEPAGAASDVFVIAKGGLGTIGLASALQSGNVITFTFEQPVCAASDSSAGQVSSVFGLTASAAPMFRAVKAGIPGTDHIDVKAMVPTH